MKKNEIGFWELSSKPSKKELASFYTNQYFDSHNFEVKYTDEEFFHKQIPYIEAEHVYSEYFGPKKADTILKFLDVGCGEGFSLNYFSKKGWDVAGTDYSSDGVNRHFPHLNKFVVTGDTEELIQKMTVESQTFDLVNVNNVLEHLLNPIEVMQGLRKLVKPNGCLRVQVPNDFPALQIYLLENQMIDHEFWVAPNEHMNYFEKDSLKNLFLHVGFTLVEALADYPIDLNLLNPDSNYVMDRTKGKHCHLARIHADNFLARKSVEDLVTFRRGCGESGLGRNVVVYGRS